MLAGRIVQIDSRKTCGSSILAPKRKHTSFFAATHLHVVIVA